MRIHWALVALLAWSSMVSIARAQETDDERARTHFLAGTDYYDQGRYADALQSFLEAYRLSHRVELLVNASRAAERNLDFQQAISLVDQFLAQAAPDHPQRATQEQRRVQLVELAARNPPRPPETTTPDASESEPESPPRLGGLGMAGVATTSAGAAIGIVSLVTGIVANNRYGDLVDRCPTGVCPAGELGDDASSGRRLARLSTATTFIGVGALAAGIVMIILDDGPPSEDAPVAVTAGPGDAGVGVRWRF